MLGAAALKDYVGTCYEATSGLRTEGLERQSGRPPKSKGFAVKAYGAEAVAGAHRNTRIGDSTKAYYYICYSKSRMTLYLANCGIQVNSDNHERVLVSTYSPKS